MKYLLVVVCLFYGVLAKHELYEGHAVYEIDVQSVEQTKLVHDFENDLHLDIWSHAVPGHPGKVLVPKDKRDIFENFLVENRVQFKIETENVKEQLDKEDELLAAAAARSNSSRIGFERIHTYEEVDAYLDELARDYPNVVSVVLGGRSVEGRPIRYLKISTTNFQDTSKPVVMMQSLLHSREWVTLPATLYAIRKLVVDVTESDLVQNIDWIILPVANPDGYVFTLTDRYWRKNRATRYMIANRCPGVDLNRNFGHGWGTASSANPCQDTFHGGSAFSEPESAAIRDIILEHSSRMAMYLDIHSFGSMILYGYGDGVLPPHALHLNFVGVQMAQAIDRVKWPSNKNYIVGNILHVLYAASGGASDYAMSVAAPYSYTYELPAYRNSVWMDGFLVEPAFIEQAGFETWEGIKVGARAAAAAFRNGKAV
ncbi:carboxypeptidase B-like [Spodoptera frugiperda]|uniref:Carboxypeptidase B-like n=2 Tax=Spodoptera frugiperda TaxID=7108 RepID=A0A9R0D7H5_SPOFR|nr:carboxypeptidase B-like [Spodoptera frugiperda]